MRDQIICEIEEFCRRRRLSGFFNNFSSYLPGGFARGYEDDILDELRSQCGEKMRKMSLREFFRDIDETIAELGLDSQRIVELQERGDIQQINEYAFPLYVRLREKGYLHYPDLVV